MKKLIAASLALLSLAAPAAARVEVEPLEGGGRFKVQFRCTPVIGCNGVNVAGSWNGWSATAQPMADKDKDGTFELALELPRGKHYYKFVINGTVWQHDADNPATETDGHSGFNSVLDLGNQAPPTAGKRGDGDVNADQLIHDPAQLEYACAVDGGRRLVVRLHALREDVERVRVSASPKPLEGDAVPARRLAVVDGRDVWEARLTWAAPPGRVRYGFSLEDGQATAAKFPAGRERFSATTEVKFATPEWVRDAIFYQIFPDRFADGDPSRHADKPRRPEGKPWHIDDRYLEAWDAEPSHFNHMGGDLAGITQKLDYIRDLGMNAIYLNPIFTAESNHKYDAADYETVDPAFGTLEDFHALRDGMRSRGMKVVLDCVFNHTGDEHYAFRDCEQKGPASKFWSWYFLDGGHPIVKSPKPNYRCWWNFGDLPQLNTANPEVVKHLMGVGKYWLKEGASGWRLDVPNEVDAINPEFWPEFRKKIKRQDPDAYIVGEIWTDARQWLQGDKFDAVMNYPVRSAALEFLGKEGITAAEFFRALGTQLATYPEPAVRVQFNLLGSHDTPRLRGVVGGDLRRARLCTSFIFAWPGAPVVYYGDEIGMDGGKDPECRRTYPWQDEKKHDKATFEHFKRLAHLRTAEPALRRGTVRFLQAEGRLAAFAREPETGEAGRPVVCVFNAASTGTTARVPLAELDLPEGVAVTSLLGPAAKVEGGALVVQLGGLDAAFVALGAPSKK
jgi:cyclomaltodextrinase